MQIFQLKAIEIVGRKNSNGGYRIWENDLGLFDARDKAEKAMNRTIQENKWSKYFAFLIYKREMNHPCLTEDDVLAITTYLADGTFFCRSLCDDACEKHFRGRPAESIKFKREDLCLYWHMGHLEPCIVDFLPYSEDGYAAFCREHGHSPDDPGFHPFDYSDDCYLVFNYNNAHNHPRCWELFPFNDVISKRNMDRLLATKKWYYDNDNCPR